MAPATLAPTPTLLGSWFARGRADLEAHLAHHGPLPAFGPRWPGQFARTVADSGLVGRGGAGFPTAVKLRALERSSRRPLLVVNAMEGEPASAKDQVLLSRVPHLVLDGAAMAAAAVGAEEIAVCVAAEHRTAHRAVARAAAERAGTALAPVPVTVHALAGGYVAGQESALVNQLAGRPGLPSFVMDKSVPLQVGRRPALVHNAETLAHMALIGRHGAAAFRAGGRADAPGTALVTVSGAVGTPGVFEVPLGTPLGEVLAPAAPVPDPVAVLVGGFGGTWLGAGHLGVPFAHGSLRALGAAPGAGVLVVLGRDRCGLATTAAIARFMAAEGAGQCGPCAFGLPALAADLHAVARGSAPAGVLEQLGTRLAAVDGRGACRHPDGVVRLVRSALDVFAADLSAHLGGHPCGRAAQEWGPAPPEGRA